MIYSFISLLFCPDPDPQIYADPDPGRAKTCGSGSETLLFILNRFGATRIQINAFLSGSGSGSEERNQTGSGSGSRAGIEVDPDPDLDLAKCSGYKWIRIRIRKAGSGS